MAIPDVDVQANGGRSDSMDGQGKAGATAFEVALGLPLAPFRSLVKQNRDPLNHVKRRVAVLSPPAKMKRLLSMIRKHYTMPIVTVLWLGDGEYLASSDSGRGSQLMSQLNEVFLGARSVVGVTRVDAVALATHTKQ